MTNEATVDYGARSSAMRVKFGRLFDQLSRLFFERDPMNLGMAFNTDEYEPEVVAVLERLGEAASPQHLRRIIFEEFKRLFGGAEAELEELGLDDEVGSEDRYEGLAQETWRLCVEDDSGRATVLGSTDRTGAT